MRVVVKKPGKVAEGRDIFDTLDCYQQIVGGYIEAVTLTPHLAMLVNEDGKMLGLPRNFTWHGDMILGTVVFVGVKGDEFTDIDDGIAQDLVEFWKEDAE